MSTSAQASTTRQRAANPNATAHPLAPNTDSDGVDHSKDGPQGKKLKETPFTSCAYLSYYPVLTCLPVLHICPLWVGRLGGTWNGRAHDPLQERWRADRPCSRLSSAAFDGSLSLQQADPRSCCHLCLLPVAAVCAVCRGRRMVEPDPRKGKGGKRRHQGRQYSLLPLRPPSCDYRRRLTLNTCLASAAEACLLSCFLGRVDGVGRGCFRQGTDDRPAADLGARQRFGSQVSHLSPPARFLLFSLRLG